MHAQASLQLLLVQELKDIRATVVQQSRLSYGIPILLVWIFLGTFTLETNKR